VPITPEGRAVLIRQYRFSVDEHCLEFPAGGMHDTGDASLEEVVRKELQEEIGAVAGAVEYVTWFYSSDSLSNEVCHVHLAFDVVITEPAETEAGEHIETVIVPVHEACALVRRGEMRTGACALSLLLCEARLRARKLL
jgi:ADP-ribose pyrophosphatase